MKKYFLVALIFGMLSILFQSCSKEEVTPAVIPPVTTPVAPVVTSAFTWKEDGGAILTADSAYWTTGSWGTGIRAYKGS